MSNCFKTVELGIFYNLIGWLGQANLVYLSGAAISFVHSVIGSPIVIKQ